MEPANNEYNPVNQRAVARARECLKDMSRGLPDIGADSNLSNSRFDSTLRECTIPRSPGIGCLSLSLDKCINLCAEGPTAEVWEDILRQEKVSYRHAKRSDTLNSEAVNIGIDTPELRQRIEQLGGIWILEPSETSGPSEPLNVLDCRLPSDYLSVETIKQGTIVKLLRSFTADLSKLNSTLHANSLFVLREALLRGFALAGIPYVHPWYYPTPTPSVCLFRVDVDYVCSDELEQMREVSCQFGIRGTYFVNISGEEEYEDEIGHLNLARPTTPERVGVLKDLLAEGNEIGNHGYWHMVFGDVQQNLENISRAQDMIRGILGCECRGFASPGCEHNAALAEALRGCSFDYGCNLACDFGAHPLFRRDGSPLEVPFSCVNDVMLEHIADPGLREFVMRRLQEFYLNWIDRQIVTGSPISILAHPHLAGRDFRLFWPVIFQKIADRQLPSFRLQEFTNWWNKRDRAIFTACLTENAIQIRTDLSPCVVEVCDGGERYLKVI